MQAAITYCLHLFHDAPIKREQHSSIRGQTDGYLAVEAVGQGDLAGRVEVVKRRDAFEHDPVAFNEQWKKEDEKTRKRIVAARTRLDTVKISDASRERAAQLCMTLGTDGLRGDLTLIRAARAYAALQGDSAINPLDDSGSTVRVDRAVAELMGA